MSELVDEDIMISNEQKDSSLTEKINLRTLIYISVMLVGGVLYSVIYSGRAETIFQHLFYAGQIIIANLVLAIILVFFRILIRRRKEKKSGVKQKHDPIWFEIVENTFALWILLTILNTIVSFL